jgi:hypothetical protein
VLDSDPVQPEDWSPSSLEKVSSCFSVKAMDTTFMAQRFGGLTSKLMYSYNGMEHRIRDLDDHE